MADSDLGMFDGNGELMWNYTFGTYSSENQSDDFWRPFDVWSGMDIVFITGNGNIWTVVDYASLRSAIDATASEFGHNLTWSASTSGSLEANVLSRGSGNAEDPWISYYGGHSSAVSGNGLLWGENDWYRASHAQLKNSNGGVNVWVSLQPAAVPLPASVVLLGSALAGMAVARRRKKPGPK